MITAEQAHDAVRDVLESAFNSFPPARKPDHEGRLFVARVIESKKPLTPQLIFAFPLEAQAVLYEALFELLMQLRAEAKQGVTYPELSAADLAPNTLGSALVSRLKIRWPD